MQSSLLSDMKKKKWLLKVHAPVIAIIHGTLTMAFYFPNGKDFGYFADKPTWLSEDDLDYYAKKFDQIGFYVGVNYYRAFDRSWELNAPWSGAQVKVPAKFIVGEFDLTSHVPGTKEFIHKGGFQKYLPLFKEVVVIEGATHFFNKERPDEISQHIHGFIKQF